MKAVVIAGNFNINFMANNTTITRFCHLLNVYNLHVLFTEPSRIAEHSKTCIGNIVANTSIAECSGYRELTHL